MPADLQAKVVPVYEPHYFNEDTAEEGVPPEQYNGIHAALDWGFADASSTEPINCKRMARSWLKQMVTAGDLLLPGDTPPKRWSQRITDKGLQALNEMPPED